MKITTFLSAICLLIVFASCNKDADEQALKIAGTVEDSKELLNQEVAGASLTLWHNKLEGGVFSNAFESITSTTSSSTGAYEFNFDRDNTIEYKITGTKQNYFDLDVRINPEDVDPGTTYYQDLSLRPKSWLSMRLNNENPDGDADQITFQYLGANFSCACCDSEDLVLIGQDVDSTEICLLEGNSWIKYYYIVDKPSGFHTVLDSVYCNSFDTTYVEIGY